MSQNAPKGGVLTRRIQFYCAILQAASLQPKLATVAAGLVDAHRMEAILSLINMLTGASNSDRSVECHRSISTGGRYGDCRAFECQQRKGLAVSSELVGATTVISHRSQLD